MKNKYTFIVLILVPLALLIGMIVVWTWENPINTDIKIDFQAFGTYGDFFGGVIGTIIAVIGVVFVYRTYENQVVSQRKNQIESRFFELIKLHEKNVEELKNIDNQIFTLYIKNIKNFIAIIKKYRKEKSKGWSDQDVAELGYLYFFFGSSEYTPERLTDIPIHATEIMELNDYIRKSGIIYKGAFAELGKYFRQLFQIVTYIDKKTELTYTEKYQYLKTLRVRLNIEEQYLLFLNSTVFIGLDWEKKQTEVNKQFITKYNLIKNIPQKFNPIVGIDVRTIYSNVYYENDSVITKTEREILEKKYK